MSMHTKKGPIRKMSMISVPSKKVDVVMKEKVAQSGQCIQEQALALADCQKFCAVTIPATVSSCFPEKCCYSYVNVPATNNQNKYHWLKIQLNMCIEVLE